MMHALPLPRPRRRLPRAVALAATVLLGACAGNGPKPPPPAAPPAQFKESAEWQRARAAHATAAVDVTDAWWQLFHDPVLDDLQQRLVIGNESLRSAVAQVANARAALQASQAALWPSVTANAGATRTGARIGNTDRRSTINTDSLTANATWEIDLWGRLSLATKAADAKLQASRDDLAAARLSAQATLVQTYFAMRAAEAQQALLERTVVADQRTLDLTEARYASGVATRGDVLQATTQLKTVQAQVQEALLQRAQLEHAIAVLLGVAPSSLTIPTTAVLPDLPPVPDVLPSTILERRPDIAGAERRVAAAYAQIGIADAAFYPVVSLGAGLGYRAASFGELFSVPSLLWSLGPALTAPIFDAGARKAASAQARANADLAVSTYRQTVLTAFQEVEDNLSIVARLGDELVLQREAVQSAQRNLEITQDQYKAGTVSYLNVVTAQTTLLSAEANVLSVRNRQLAAADVLLKNIGGRWQEP